MGENQFLRKSEAEMRHAYYAPESAYNCVGNENFMLKAKNEVYHSNIMQFRNVRNYATLLPRIILRKDDTFLHTIVRRNS
jgi:hypothetical protein